MNDPAPAPRPNGKNALEWAVFAFSGLLVAATIAILIRETVLWKGTPANLTATPGTTWTTPGRTWVPVEVRNSGDEAAAAVEIEVAMGTNSSAEPATATFTIDHLPRGAMRKGQVSFAGDRQGQAFDVRVVGYGEP